MCSRSPQTRLRILKKASWAGIIGNTTLSAVKIIAGWLSGSLAVVGDGLDSLTDVVTSMVTLYAAKTGAAPPDAEHPWGHGRAETIATKTLSLIIIMAGIQLFLMSFRKITGDADRVAPGQLALLVSGISILGKAGLAMYKHRAGKMAESPMMSVDAMHTRNDIFLSFSVLAGVFFTRILQLPVLDLIFGMLISVWIIVSGVKVFLHANTELMDSVEDKNLYLRVFESVEAVNGMEKPHRVRIRRLNSLYVIDLDVEVDGSLSVQEAHRLACMLESEIRLRIKNVFDIMVHVEPAGGGFHKEAYGLVPEDISFPGSRDS